jgi:hypothetical protein
MRSKKIQKLRLKNPDAVSMIIWINNEVEVDKRLLRLVMDFGDVLMLITDYAVTPPDLAQLERAYDAVIQCISQNWRRGYLKDYPSLVGRFSEEEFMLFHNPNSLFSTDEVVRFFSQEACFPVFPVGDYYMWIKKDRLEETLNALNIHPVI